MDAAMEDAAAGPASTELGFFDGRDFAPDYEFDALQFYDFTRPETQFDVVEAERWFETAPSYPPSPFVIEMMWNEDSGETEANAACMTENAPSSCSISVMSHNTGCLSEQDDRQNGPSAPKSSAKKMSTLFKGSTLMKPTASHLAKLNHRKEVSNSLRLLKPVVKSKEKSLQNPIVQNQATKRQKLETGYLWKVAKLNHQAVFAHKKSTEVDHMAKKSNNAKKLTVPKEPNLATACRAQIRCSRRKDTVAQVDDLKSSTSSLKASPLRKKILENSSFPLPRREIPPSTEFQEFRFKTSKRAMPHFYDNATREPISISISQTETIVSERSSYASSLRWIKSETTRKILTSRQGLGTYRNTRRDSTILEEPKLLNKKASRLPPIELFSKLSLIPDRQREASQPNHLLTTKVR